MNAHAEASGPRITIAIDTSLRSLEMLELAAALAVARQAELEALFVEDINLFSLAGLPFAREFDRSSGRARALDQLLMAHDLRGRLLRIERALADAVREHRLRTRIKVCRGHFANEVMVAAGNTDALILVRSQRASFRRPRNYRLSAGRAASVARARMQVWLVFDGSECAERSLRLADELAELIGADLGIALLISEDSSRAQMKESARAIIGADQRVHFAKMPTSDATGSTTLPYESDTPLVLPIHLAGARPDLVERQSGPLILVK